MPWSQADPSRIDPTEPFEIGPGVWWVGHKLEGDPFQCHSYLIDNGDESVLLDPGSVLTLEVTLKKVEQVVGLRRVKYFLCHHPDPDITGAFGALCQLPLHKEACIVTHWRSEKLMRHLGLPLPYWLVEEHDWRLELRDRKLEFIFTPYMHFPGAFCSFDRSSGILFSSDVFGGFGDDWTLYAQDESYFEAIRPFHEHYMPSREVLVHGLNKLERLPIRVIAPQHGSIIPQSLVRPMFEKLRSIECGLYLMAGAETDVVKLSELNRRLKGVMNAMVLYRDFRDVVRSLLDLVRSLVPAAIGLEFYATWGGDEVLYLGPRNRYRGVPVKPPKFCLGLLGGDARGQSIGEAPQSQDIVREQGETGDLGKTQRVVLMPLFQPNVGEVDALGVILLEHDTTLSVDARRALEEIRAPLHVAIERERILRHLEEDRQSMYEVSIRDPLTKLYTRYYLQESAQRFLDIHDRDPTAPVAVLMLDLDHFKEINDTHGHATGDQVLRKVAASLLEITRESDIPVRLGGEEFLVLLAGRSALYAPRVAERIRQNVAELSFTSEQGPFRATTSAGVAIREQGESLASLIQRADRALYRAKREGRNAVRVDDILDPSNG